MSSVFTVYSHAHFYPTILSTKIRWKTNLFFESVDDELDNKRQNIPADASRLTNYPSLFVRRLHRLCGRLKVTGTLDTIDDRWPGTLPSRNNVTWQYRPEVCFGPVTYGPNWTKRKADKTLQCDSMDLLLLFFESVEWKKIPHKRPIL